MVKKKSFLKPFSDAKVWLHWIIIAAVVSYLMAGTAPPLVFAFWLFINTLVIAVTDVVAEKILGI